MSDIQMGFMNFPFNSKYLKKDKKKKKCFDGFALQEILALFPWKTIEMVEKTVTASMLKKKQQACDYDDPVLITGENVFL